MKVVIWGHPLHTHTHSYIHYAFTKGFEYLDHKVRWLDNLKDESIKNSIVLTEGQVDSNIPLDKSNKYILHNCNMQKYKDFGVDYKILQVYTHDCLARDVEKLADCEYYDQKERTLYQPWATDLLPNEFDKFDSVIWDTAEKEKTVWWVGSIMGGEHGNINELQDFAAGCKKHGIEIKTKRGISAEENIELVRKSVIAPALQGAWQVDNGYVPCRIFKNISYGHLGATNSKTVFDLFNGEISYSDNCEELADIAMRDLAEKSLGERLKIVSLVRDKHTYLNRIKSLLKVL